MPYNNPSILVPVCMSVNTIIEKIADTIIKLVIQVVRISMSVNSEDNTTNPPANHATVNGTTMIINAAITLIISKSLRLMGNA